MCEAVSAAPWMMQEHCQNPYFSRLSLAYPEPILLVGFVLYTVSTTSSFLMLTPNLPLSIILFFPLKWLSLSQNTSKHFLL